MDNADKIQLAIAGCGVHSYVHAAAIKACSGIELAACCDTRFDRAQAWAEQNGCTPYAELAEMIAREKIDAIILCTWPNQHLAQIEQCLEKGIMHILCEKALVTGSKEAHRLWQLAREKKACIMEGSMYRHHPAIKKMQEIVFDPGNGPIDCIHAVFSNYEPSAHKDCLDSTDWRYRKECSGGVTHDWMNYCVNAANFFSRSKPVRVFASGNINQEYGVIDKIYGQIVYENGITGIIESSKYAGFSQLLRVSCAHGLIELPVAWGIFGDTAILRHHHKEKWNYILTDRFEVETEDVYVLQLQNFLQVIRKEAEPIMPLRESLLNAETTEALIQSVRQQKIIEVDSML